MAQNFLYMFEFVVDDLLITRPNFCAPEEYPTCCEISFRSSVFVSICDREFGQCVDTCAPKCGKCCIFSLESPVTDKDRLLIHIYKKKTDKCKFLVGATDLPIKPLFDKVTENFNIENPNWMEQLARHTARLPDPKTPSKTAVCDNDCDEEGTGRREQMCPTSELTKRLLPLFNMKNLQTGNLVLIMRLVCNGPAIVSSFPFSRVCNAPCPKKGSPCPICPPPEFPNKAGGPMACPMPDPCKKEPNVPPVCRRYFACNADKGCPCEQCEDECDRNCPTVVCCKKNKKKPKPCPACCPPPPPPPCCPPEPCKKPEPKVDPCQRYFNNNRNNGGNSGNGGNGGNGGNNGNNCSSTSDKCPCDECAEECEAEEGSEESLGLCMPPCFITPSKPEPGPEAYEEFEASLNGSGLVIRVLKDTHQVQNINDGTEGHVEDRDDDLDKKKKGGCPNPQCESICEILQRSNFARNHVARRTAGHIINHPKLPKIRANIKYSGNESCTENYHIPFTKIKQFCDSQDNKIDNYRKIRPIEDTCARPEHPGDIRNCCLQVDPQDIKNALKGINADTRKKGIEVCYKTCDDTDSDVFLVKLGSKQKCQKKKNSIEIELKTPKQPIQLPIQKVTTETQINEAELDAALSGVCGKKGKKGKGKKGKKGKK